MIKKLSLEIYKDVDGYPNYQVTSWGRVLNKTTGKFIAQDETSKGYLRVTLWSDGRKRNHKVHRLVAKAFLPNTFNKPQVNHIDGNPQNNSVTNLEWVTNAENAEKARLIKMIEGCGGGGTGSEN